MRQCCMVQGRRRVTEGIATVPAGGARRVVEAFGNRMPGILVVERSTTLNHLLKRTLTAAGISVRSELASYFEAIDHLRRSADLEQPYGLLLVGAPARMTREFSALLEFLRGPDGAVLPVVLMTHEMLPELEDFARMRGSLSLLLWTHFNRLPGYI